ncbi:hypothetical protein [Nocardia asteroides]|uniref:Uncharacterized protein n=1 Tax=Nocardia asteroides NBRC 15531 TaxID=1110697 RepID=U5EEK3_NOCAS|nr:hypothetical protein [Nocardia asteroides]TLF67454.1 hypothetical protein FEK33_16035 [Nocardia asteroides NBRC 15531]UGT51056.1 hypothetical protein LT345_11185 [Nocardia asteroides]SFN40239.1 hypothetical protein SAMN05444423_1096 [Nocardia asteroides]VEG36077.1 Uncharacterised protein [Nocardia asteroides]GAD85760.1 hypothetical protein NCAST_32_02430 [Nocardia asteroides NBRC 15531]
MSDIDEYGRTALSAAVDATIIAVRRMFYVLGDDIDTAEGPIEFTFHDGSTLLLDVGVDGAELRIGAAPWRDPFEPLVDPVNIEYVAASGKYTAFDVTDEHPYVLFAGRRVDAVSVVPLPDGRPRAATLYLGEGMVKAESIADELIVTLVPA